MTKLAPMISIDGINNAGKTTAIYELGSLLSQEGRNVSYCRGDGVRSGLGATALDPPSDWWQKNSALLRGKHVGDRPPDIERRVAAIASLRLAHEAANLRTAISSDPDAILLQDRGVISRLFVADRYEPGTTLSDIMPGSMRYDRSKVIPDLVFILHCSVEQLFIRNETRDSPDSKKAFNKDIILKYYDDFYKVALQPPPELKDRVLVINANSSAEDVVGNLYDGMRSRGLL